MSITRIQNNQITDSTIVAYAKLQSGSLTGNLFAPTITLNSNVTINGNLFLSNTGNTTTINATNTYINDPLVVFNNGYTGSLSGYDIGILVNRNLSALAPYGSAVNSAWVWVENDQAFESLITTDAGTGATSINNSGYANVKTGNTTMVSGSVTGTLTVTGATTLTTANVGGLQAVAIGNVTAGTGAFTTATTGGLQAVAIGNATPGTGVFTTGTFNTATTGGLQAVAIGNATPGTATFTTATTGGLQAVAIGNATPGSGAFTTGTFSSTLGVTGATTMTTATTGGLQAVAIGNATPGSGAFTTGTFSSTLGVTGATTMTTATTGGLQAVAIGNATPGSGAFTTLGASGITQLTNATQATSTTTGALQVTGGISTQANLYVGGNVKVFGSLEVDGTITYLNTTTTTISGTEVVAGVLTANSTTASTSTTTGALIVAGGTGIAGALYTGGITVHAGNVVAASGTASTNTTTGALVVSGGVGVSGAVNTGANVSIGGSLPGLITAAGSNSNLIIDPDGSGNIILSANTLINYGTVSTSTTTGALVVIGGVGISGSVFASGVNVSTLTASGVSTLGGNVVITSGTDVTAASGVGALLVTGTGGASIASNVSIGNNLYVGGSSAFGQALSSAGIVVSKGAAAYAQIALKNTSNTGSADYAAYADNGSDAGGWVDMGVAGSAFGDPSYTITKAQDGYLITRPTSNTYGGNLVIGTSEAGSYNDIVIGVGSFYSNSEVARFHGNASTSGTFVLKLPTNATGAPTANTGALQVWGGASFGGNVYHSGATVFNGSKTAGYDTIVKGASDNTLIWARPNATYDTVIIGNSATASTVVNGAKLNINTTDSILLPVGTNAQRPGSAGYSDVAGMLRYSSTANAIEWYTGSSWQTASTNFTVIADQQFTGTGSTPTFTLSTSQTTNSCIVSINGVLQIPTLAYSVSGTTLTFTENPANGDVIDVRMLTTTNTVTGLADTSGYNTVNVITGTGVTFTTGTVAQTTQYTIDTNGGFVTNGSNVTIASAGTSVVDNLFANSYSSAKYTITATLAGTNIREITEVLMVHTGNGAGAGSVYMSSYGRVNTAGNTLVTYSGSTSGNIAQLQATTTNANTILRIKRDYMAI